METAAVIIAVVALILVIIFEAGVMLDRRTNEKRFRQIEDDNEFRAAVYGHSGVKISLRKNVDVTEPAPEKREED